MAIRIKLVWVFAGILIAGVVAWSAAADGFGTIGIRFEQLYWDDHPDKRGPLVVLAVEEGLPGAKAGVQRGDIVFAIDGVPVMGRDLAEIERKAIRGPVGSTVHLSFAHLDGSQSELAVTRAPYPPYLNAASDQFAYSIPGSWRIDPRYDFPLAWAASIVYHGSEDVAFSPDFDFSDSPEYHSYLFFWWLDGTPTLTAKQLESDMVVYFQGLAEQRGKRNGFQPDASKVAASYSADPAGPQNFGGATASSFKGVVSIYDTHGKVIDLNSEVVTGVCPGSDHTVAFFGMSMQPRQEGIWKSIDTVRDSFRCSR